MEKEPMKAMGADLGLDLLMARYIKALGKDLSSPYLTLSLKEAAGLLLILQTKSALILSTEN